MLIIRVLGQFGVQVDDTPVQIASRPAQSLLSRLVLTPGIAHRREKLAGEQWPDASERNALSNLRHALWRIRAALKSAGANSYHFITSDDIVISFNAQSAFWVDALTLEQESKRTTATTNGLMQAAALYQGELLPGFYDESDEWVTPFRARTKMTFDRLMARLTEHQHNERQWQHLVASCKHWIAHGESREPAARALMIAHYALGDLAGMQSEYRDCAAWLRKEMDADPSAETRALYEQLLNGAYSLTPTPPRNGTAPKPAPDAAAHAATEPPPNNLPVHPTPFVGRSNDLKEIAKRVAQPDCQLITLIGPGGVGKTRLAIKAASAVLREREMAEVFADGVYFARLDAATTGEALLTALSDAVRHVPFGQESPKAQLLNFLREKKMLLVLDNFEQLLRDDVDGASAVGEIMATAPGVKILVTSRERLHLPGEYLIEVDGLDYPSPDDPQAEADADDLERFGAVQLFLQAARRILSRFSFEVEKAGVVRICQLTQGMPLALELAAAWVRALSCKEIAARIEHNLDVLAVTDPDLSDRHRSVRAVLNYSWQLLSPQERNAFAALSVFRAGFELDAAEDVARTTVTMLFALVDKSLLRRTPAGRYEMHDLVRRYGEEKLDASEDEDYSPNTVHARMARYFLQFAQAHGKDYPALEPEWSNFLAAMRAAHERYEWSSVTQMAQALLDAWFTRARFSDAREGLKMASEAAAADDDLPVLANVLRWRGRACIEQGDYEEANSFFEAALSLAKQLGNQQITADILRHQAWLATEQTEHQWATKLLDESLDIRESIHDTHGIGEVLFQQARLNYLIDEYDKSKSLVERALTLLEDAKDDGGTLASLRLLASIASDTGEYQTAKAYAERALALAQQVNDKAELASVLYILSQISRKVRSLTDARNYAQSSLQLQKQFGRRKSQAHLYLQLSFISFDEGNYDLALLEAQHSLATYKQLDDDWNMVTALYMLGNILNVKNQSDQASTVWSDGLNLALRIRHPQAALIEEALAQIKK